MKSPTLSCWFALLLLTVQAQAQTDYGSNSEAGSYLPVNGVDIYYETYGAGEPLLILHGNGSSISGMSAQIDYFRNHYRVIAIDSRGHGNSDLGDSPLGYRQMASDIATLVTALSLGKVHVIGWSDGGVIGLILGIEFPQVVNKLALMAPTLRPDESAVDGTLIELVEARLDFINEKIAAGDESEDWERARQQLAMVLTQPSISIEELKTISAPTLIIAGDRDLIRNQHTVEIFESLANAHLAILPNETHFTPVTNPALFNSMVDSFLKSPFQRADSMDVLDQRE